MTQYLAPFSFGRAVVDAGADLVVSRTQRELALGYRGGDVATGSGNGSYSGRFVDGLLANYDNESEALNRTVDDTLAVYSCYDAVYAVSNGRWARMSIYL